MSRVGSRKAGSLEAWTRDRFGDGFELVLIALVTAAALPVSGAAAAYPGKPGPIVYNKYKDVEVLNESNGLLEVHPEGGLLSHGPRQAEGAVQLTGEASDGDPAYSADGRLIAFSSSRGQEGSWRTSQIYLMRSDGSGVRRVSDSPAPADGAYFSPDGRRLVFVRSQPEQGISHLWLLTIATGAEEQLTFGDHADAQPVFTPSGKRILFSSDRKASGGHDKSDIWAIGSDGRNPRVLVDESGAEVSPDVSPDGRRIGFIVEQGSSFGFGNLRIARSDGHVLRSLDEKAGPECRPCYGYPSWAPDGKHLAAAERSGTSGSTALMVITPDGSHRRQFDAGTVSTEGTGRHIGAPAWGSAAGR